RRMLPNARARQRFEREAKAAARLHHTNIVPVFGVGEQDGLPYYVMQFIQGQGLDLVLEELKRLKAGGGTMGNLAGLPLPGGPSADSPQRALKAGRPGALKAGRPGDVSVADLARSLITGEFRAVEEPSPAPAETRDGSAEAAGPPPSPPPGPLSASSATRTVSSGSITLPGQSGEAHQRQAKKQSY